MSLPCFLGDEASAAGYRLAGVAAIVPEPGGEDAALARAREESPLVLVSAAVAARVAPGRMRAALAALVPLVVVVPDLRGEVPLPDLAARLKAQLGLEA